MQIINLDGKFIRLKEILKNNRTPLIFCILYTGIFSIATILRYETFNAAIMDIGVEMHELFLISKGYLYFFNVNGSLSNVSLLAGYFEILYIPLGFIYKIIPHVSFFLILQSFLIGVSAFPFYYISRDLLGNKWGFIGPLFILLNPQIHTGNMYDFHISVFYVPFISFALYFVFKKEFFLSYFFSFLVIIVKADSFMYVTAIAVLMLFSGYKKKHVFILLFLAWTYGFFVIFYILPHFNVHGMWGSGTGHPIYPLLTEGVNSLKSGNIGGFIMSIINPLFENIRHNIRFLLYILVSLGLMPLFSKKYVIITLFPLSVCWLVGFHHDRIYYPPPLLAIQYSFFIIPFFVFVSIHGLKNFIAFIKKSNFKLLKERFSLIFVCFILSATFIVQYHSSLTNFVLTDMYSMQTYTIKKGMHLKSLNIALKKIPPEYSVSASSFIGGHLYGHYVLTKFPIGIKYADYVVFSRCYFYLYSKKKNLEYLTVFDSLKKSGRYDIVYNKGCNTILKLKRKYGYKIPA